MTTTITNFGQLQQSSLPSAQGYAGAGTLFANVLQTLSPGGRLLLSSYNQMAFFVGTGGSNQTTYQTLQLGYSNSTFGGPLQFVGCNSTSFQFLPQDSMQTIYLGSNYYTYMSNGYQSANTTQSDGFQFEQPITGQKTIRAMQGIWASPGQGQSNLASLGNVAHSLMTQNGLLELQSSNTLGASISFNNISYPGSNQWNWMFTGPGQDGSLALNYTTTTYTGGNSNTTTTQFLQGNSNGLIVTQSVSVPVINSSQSAPLTVPLTLKAQQYVMNLYGGSGLSIQQSQTNTQQTVIKALNQNSLQLVATDAQNTVQLSSTQVYQQSINNINQQVFKLDASQTQTAFYFSNPVNFTSITAPSAQIDTISPYTTTNNQVTINSDVVITGGMKIKGDVDTVNQTTLSIEDNIVSLAKGASNTSVYDGTANDQSGIVVNGIISNVTDSNVYRKDFLWRYNGGINASQLSNRSYWELQGGGFNLARYIPSQSNMVQYQTAIDDDQSYVLSQITSNANVKIFQMGLLPSNLIYT